MPAPRLFTALALTGVLALSSCSVIDNLVGEPAPVEQSEDQDSNSGAESTDTPDVDDTVAVEEDVVPDCTSMYSDSVESAFTEDGRLLLDDQSGSGYGWGSVNPALVKILEAVRQDLRVSCTWFKPPGESGSTTTIAIIASDIVPDIEEALRADAGTSEALGEGTLWKLDQTSSNISGEFDANETHFLVTTGCPASLAEPECTLWISTSFSFGSSERLTRDAAEVLGKL
jgi:hypothetical protein